MTAGVRARRLAYGLVAAWVPAAASPVSAFEGRYRAGTPEYEQTITVRKSGQGYRGDATVATRGCVGDFKGTGRPSGDRLVLVGRENTYACRLTLSRAGSKTLQVEEDGCLTFHGSACAFSGTYGRQAR